MPAYSKMLEKINFSRDSFGGVGGADLWYKICNSRQFAFSWMKFASSGPFRYFDKSDNHLIESVQKESLCCLIEKSLTRASEFVGHPFAESLVRDYLYKDVSSSLAMSEGFLIQSIHLGDRADASQRYIVDLYLEERKVVAVLYHSEPLSVINYEVTLSDSDRVSKQNLIEAFSQWGLSSIISLTDLSLRGFENVESGSEATLKHYPQLFGSEDEEEVDTDISV